MINFRIDYIMLVDQTVRLASSQVKKSILEIDNLALLILKLLESNYPNHEHKEACLRLLGDILFISDKICSDLC